MKELVTEIIINAPKNTVWKVLTNFNHYAEWNPFIVSSQGQAKENTRLVNSMKQGEKTFTFKPTLTRVEEASYLEWLGQLIIPGLFDGRHYFRLEEIKPGVTKLTQGEKFSGLLRGIILKNAAENTRAGFIAMNRALKQRAEHHTATVASGSSV